MTSGIVFRICAMLMILSPTILGESPPEKSDYQKTTTQQIIVTSSPDSAIVFINSVALDDLTPVTIKTNSDSLVIEVFRDGYELLEYVIRPDSQFPVKLSFILRALPPVKQPPESLGLSFLETQTILDEKLAEKNSKFWFDLSDTFIVVPFGQGLMASMFVDSKDRKTANILVISGALLTVGSYLTGRILHKKKLKNIRRRNQEIEIENFRAKEYNQQIKREINSKHGKEMLFWRRASSGRGRVEITFSSE